MTEQEIRAMRVAEAVHSARMEGGDVTSSFFADARDYIEEQIDAHGRTNRRTRIG
ncbi:antitoxin VbhA family protein [Bifidobacterium longum]|uniref:antitoxin VbhA family protein n=1 Tax=Bifidobacterium longum TaxID=216816 RepID=UPI001D0D7404|nr:antitoxin VbhA family protein [Bifidobacterium longum]